MSEFTNRIDTLLTDRRLKRSDLCRATDISESTVRNWITRDSTPSMDKVIKIAKFFDVSPEWLADGVSPDSSEANEVVFHLNLSEQEIINIYRKLDGRDKEILYQYARMLEMQDIKRREIEK